MIGSTSLVAALLGVGLGARHALEPDHLAAVSVLTADGPSARRGMLVGALWGVGHALALLACGLVVACAAAEIPVRLADAFEIAVAAMLVGLGARAVVRAVREGRLGSPTSHHHRDGAAHVHAGPAAHVHVARRVLAVRPLIVGAIHGLAGSGALTALVISRLPTTAGRLFFMLLFGIGSIAAMTAISGLAGWPLARLSRRRAASRMLLGVTGAASIALGLLWALLPVRRMFC